MRKTEIGKNLMGLINGPHCSPHQIIPGEEEKVDFVVIVTPSNVFVIKERSQGGD
jgi:hypothetical protein